MRDRFVNKSLLTTVLIGGGLAIGCSVWAQSGSPAWTAATVQPEPEQLVIQTLPPIDNPPAAFAQQPSHPVATPALEFRPLDMPLPGDANPPSIIRERSQPESSTALPQHSIFVAADAATEVRGMGTPTIPDPPASEPLQSPSFQAPSLNSIPAVSVSKFQQQYKSASRGLRQRVQAAGNAPVINVDVPERLAMNQGLAFDALSDEPAETNLPGEVLPGTTDFDQQFEGQFNAQLRQSDDLPVMASAAEDNESGSAPTYEFSESQETDFAGPFNGLDEFELPRTSIDTTQFQISPVAWWQSSVTMPLQGETGFEQSKAESVDVNQLVYQALRNSPRIAAISQEPLIRELQVVEADADFDATRFVRSQYQDRVDPVGNTLTTGNGEPFLKDNIWTADLGLRRKARTGATYELNQRLGFQNSNSNFFVPQDQGTATLSLNVTQPLLRGRGQYVNNAQVLIAQTTGGAAWDALQSQLQEELLGVVTAYWQLYLDRSLYLQKKANVRRGAEIYARLNGRRDLDSLPSQIARARAAVETRQTALVNALRDVQ